MMVKLSAVSICLVLLVSRSAYSQNSPCVSSANPLCSGLKACYSSAPAAPQCGVGECTKITHHFLFKAAVIKTGKPADYDPSSTSPIYVCRAYKFDETIKKIEARFVLELGAMCDPDTESRLLSDDRMDQIPVVNSLHRRLLQLEDIAHTKSSTADMCKLHEFARCQRQYGGVGMCTCYNRIQPLTPTGGKESCLEHGAQGKLCGTAVTYSSKTHGSSSEAIFTDGYINNDRVHLPNSLADPKTITCLKQPVLTSVTPPVPAYNLNCSAHPVLDPPVGICVCPSNYNGKELDCSSNAGATSASLDFTYQTQHTGMAGTSDALKLLNDELQELEKRMTLVSHGAPCGTTPVLAELPALWAWLDVLQEKGMKKEDEIKTWTASVKRIKAESVRISAALCGFKKVNGKIARHPNTQFPIRLHCEMDPSTKRNYCVHTLFVDPSYISDVLDQVPQNQVPMHLDSGPRSNCDVAAQNYFHDLLIQIEQQVDKSGTADELNPALIKFKFDLIHLETNFAKKELCNSIKYPGIYCVSGKCTCGDGTYLSDYEWSNSRQKCVLNFGRPCQECRPQNEVKPILFVTCEGPELECEDGGLCTNVYGYPETSKICVRVKQLPTHETPRDGAQVLMASWTLIIAAMFL